MKSYDKILIVRTDRIGDVVLTTPALKTLRQAYPKAKISLLVAPATRDLVYCNPHINEVIVDDRRGQHKGLQGFLKLIKAIRAQEFDAAIIFHTKKRTNLLCFLAGIPQRIGYKNNKFGFLLTHPIEDSRHEGKKHEVQYCLDVLKIMGIQQASSLNTEVCIKEESEQWCQSLLTINNMNPQNKLIAIHPGASDPSKRWPQDMFAMLIDSLASQYPSRFILVGDPQTKEIATQIRESAQSDILDVSGKTTVSQLASLLKRCDLLISNDSGPVHVAEGVGTPVVSIFTRNQPGINCERWGTLGKKSQTVSVPFDDTISFAKAQQMDAKYLQKIRVEDVLEAVDSLFKLC